MQIPPKPTLFAAACARHLPARWAPFTVACLVEAVVYAIDQLTGPYVPLGPCYLLPIGIAAWYQGVPSTAFFVILSAILRTFGLAPLLPPGAKAFYVSDLLASLLMYGVFAFALVRLRSLHRQMAGYTGILEDRVRQVEQWKKVASGIRRAVLADVDTIVALAALGAEDGDLDKEVMNLERQQELRTIYGDSIRQGLAQRPTWQRTKEIVPIEFWVAEIDGKIAGFFILMGIDKGFGTERELHAISVAREFRSMGVGAAMVDFFCAHYYGRKLYAACKPDSRMYKMLKKRGFYHFTNTSQGFVIVERVERPREKGLLRDTPTPQETTTTT